MKYANKQTPVSVDTNFHLYLLVGQSNMAGRGFQGNTFVIGVRNGRVTFFDSKGVLTTVKYTDFKRMGGK